MIRALFEAGADVFRFNFSHGSHEEHRARYDIVRAIEQETGRPIAVLADLQGPKLRVGTLGRRPDRARRRASGIRFDLDPAPGDARPGPAAASRRSSRPWRPASICCSTTARSGSRSRRPAPSSAIARVLIGGRLVRAQGRERGRRRAADVGRDRQGPPRPRLRARARRRLGGAVVRPASGGSGRTARAGGPAVSVIRPSSRSRPRSSSSKRSWPAPTPSWSRAATSGSRCRPRRCRRSRGRSLRACRKAGKPVIVATQMLESHDRGADAHPRRGLRRRDRRLRGADAVMLSAESAAGPLSAWRRCG